MTDTERQARSRTEGEALMHVWMVRDADQRIVENIEIQSVGLIGSYPDTRLEVTFTYHRSATKPLERTRISVWEKGLWRPGWEPPLDIPARSLAETMIDEIQLVGMGD